MADKAFGEVLRELRLEKGLSQEQLALDADLQRNYVSLLERGLNSATLKTVFKIAPVLGIKASAMLQLVEEKAGKSSRGPAKRPRRVTRKPSTAKA
ncbi:helix-turn-helix domain-containing protein [Solimonas aquatica]|uniref:helix-turn-helix domain-containing protein n=1 Tax=Solimonas aquatica TaxID=489703 RepID=UPI000B887F5F|nr:helix-turn-helix transcriptional regulator [Solimonas aquatica]